MTLQTAQFICGTIIPFSVLGLIVLLDKMKVI